MEAAALLQVLLEKMMSEIEDETFPSATMMDRVEAELRTRDQVEEYVKVLMAKITSTRYSSIPMVNRVEALLDTLE
jgi:hypothetical protein